MDQTITGMETRMDPRIPTKTVMVAIQRPLAKVDGTKMIKMVRPAVAKNTGIQTAGIADTTDKLTLF